MTFELLTPQESVLWRNCVSLSVIYAISVSVTACLQH